MLNETGLSFTFATDIGCYEEGVLYFFERNPAGRGLDFAENLEQEEDFLRYAMELHYLNPVQDIAQYSLPQVEEIARGTEILLDAFKQPGTQKRKDLDAALRAARTSVDWCMHRDAHCQKNLALNYHLGAGGVMSLGRIQDPEGAKQLVILYQTAAGAAATIIKGRFSLMTYKDALTGKLKVEERMTTGDMRQPSDRS